MKQEETTKVLVTLPKSLHKKLMLRRIESHLSMNSQILVALERVFDKIEKGEWK